ncbi:MAG TPA: VWA domain-containing protein [Vicinamibacteria bacterium]|nr:VWA domain-containing protein [Vicinamibacteria bacterium]
MALRLAAATLLMLAPLAAQGEERRTVTFTVTDEKGRPVEGLTAEEVAVVENGATRTPLSLERDRRPLRLALVVDTSQPMGGVYRLQVLDPVLRFLTRLPEGTQFSVWTTGDRPHKLVDYGAGPAAATRALQRVFPTGGNTLLDALVEASRDLKSEEAARSAIVVVTGTGIGFANYSKEQVVDTVRGSGATVLTAQIEDVGRGGGRGAGEVSQVDYQYVTGNLAEDTGGRREVLLSAMGTGRALDSFAAELASRYRLAYDSVPGRKDGKLEVKVARPGARVRVVAPKD